MQYTNISIFLVSYSLFYILEWKKPMTDKDYILYSTFVFFLSQILIGVFIMGLYILNNNYYCFGIIALITNILIFLLTTCKIVYNFLYTDYSNPKELEDTNSSEVFYFWYQNFFPFIFWLNSLFKIIYMCYWDSYLQIFKNFTYNKVFDYLYQYILYLLLVSSISMIIVLLTNFGQYLFVDSFSLSVFISGFY